MRFYMAHIPDTETENEPATRGARTAFIGCFVPQRIKDALKNEARYAPGGARDLTWLINSILERHVNAKTKGKR